MNTQQLVEIISQYGFPIVAAVGMSYFVYFVYQFVTKQLTPVIDETHTILIALIDRIRMLDNDLLRLQQKVNVVLQIEKEKNGNKKEVVKK